MKGNADTYPLIIEKSNGKFQIRYNIIENIKEFCISFDFDYVEIDGELTRDKIINAIISDTYSKSAELALINNEIKNSGTIEYAEYQLLRSKSKEIADKIIY